MTHRFFIVAFTILMVGLVAMAAAPTASANYTDGPVPCQLDHLYGVLRCEAKTACVDDHCVRVSEITVDLW